MKDIIDALDEIHKGACMGVDAINIIMEKVENDKLLKELESELSEYKKIAKVIEDIYPDYNEGKPHATNVVDKAMTWSSVEMKTMNNDTTSNIAELLLKGVNMGIIEGRRVLKKDLDEKVHGIVDEYVAMQERNYDNLKEYL